MHLHEYFDILVIWKIVIIYILAADITFHKSFFLILAHP